MTDPWKPQCLKFSKSTLCSRAYDHLGACDFAGDRDDDTDPNELGTFGEYLNHYTARGGMTADERTAFWMGWSRHTIAWVFITAMALIVRGMYSGLVDTIATLIGAGAIVALVWQAVDAVRFRREGRRWK